jgi:hypothetical protein
MPVLNLRDYHIILKEARESIESIINLQKYFDVVIVMCGVVV